MKEYKIVHIGSGATVKKIREKTERTSNEMAAGGWELKIGSVLGYIFEREKP